MTFQDVNNIYFGYQHEIMYAENALYRTQKLLNVKTSKINMGSK